LAAVSQRFVIANVAFNVELQWRKLKQLLGRTQIAKVFLSAIFNTKARKIPGNNLTISLWTGRQTGENKKKRKGEGASSQFANGGKYDFCFLASACFYFPTAAY